MVLVYSLQLSQWGTATCVPNFRGEDDIKAGAYIMFAVSGSMLLHATLAHMLVWMHNRSWMRMSMHGIPGMHNPGMHNRS